MPEVLIKYRNAKALKALQDLTKLFDITIESTVTEKTSTEKGQATNLPITFATNPT